MAGMGAGPPLPESRWTDELSRFVFPEMDAGDYRVEALVQGLPPIAKDVRVTSEDARVDVRLEAPAGAARTGTLVVQVLDPEGNPAAGAAVRADVEGVPLNQHETGADGKVEFINLAAPRLR